MESGAIRPLAPNVEAQRQAVSGACGLSAAATCWASYAGLRPSSQNDRRRLAPVHRRMDDPVVRGVVAAAAVFRVSRPLQHPAPKVAKAIDVVRRVEREDEARRLVCESKCAPTALGHVADHLASGNGVDLVPTSVAGVVDPTASDDHDGAAIERAGFHADVERSARTRLAL